MKTEKARRLKLFAAAYRKSFNATEAAIAAGYSKGGARTRGYELLQLPEVQEMLRAAEEKIVEAAEVTELDVLRELAHIAFLDFGDAFDADGKLLPVQPVDGKRMPESVRRAIAGFEVEELFEGRGEERSQVGVLRKVKHADKLRALELIGKKLGMFVEKHQVEHKLTLEELILGKPKDSANG